jgi:dTMP kinase
MSILVIEGLDGAGKSTQVNLLINYLSEKGLQCEFLHFPVTGSPVFGDLVARFLRGELGELNNVNPYLVALIYAGDRFNAKPIIEKWLNQNIIIILDRYVYSNVAYQCAKIKLPAEKEQLKKWIISTEFDYFKLPAPDLNFFLDVPFSFTKQKLSEHRAGTDRLYLEGKRDIHEEDINFQINVRDMYLSLENDRFIRVDCCKDSETILSPDEIFQKIVSLVNVRMGIF